MGRVTIPSIIKTSIVTAFTIATALIWKDVIMDVIETFFPASDTLMYKFIVAVVATIILIFSIYIILKTESEAESIINRLKKREQRLAESKNLIEKKK